MRRSTRPLFLALACASLLCLSSAQAQSSYAVGQRLSAEQIQTLGNLQAIDIGAKQYQVLQTGQNAQGVAYTMLLDKSRRVGQTYHELIIAERPTEKVRQQLGTIASQAQLVNYYDQTQITLMRFATLDQAIKALAQARAAMPDAEIGLPISFSRPSLR